MTFLLTLKIFSFVEINFWKAPSRITFKNLEIFQRKYISVLFKPLPLRFAVSLLMILKLMILQTLIRKYFFLVTIFLFNLLYPIVIVF